MTCVEYEGTGGCGGDAPRARTNESFVGSRSMQLASTKCQQRMPARSRQFRLHVVSLAAVQIIRSLETTATMASSSNATAQAASLLLQTPPGQTSKVYHDLRALLESGGQSNASAELKKHAEPILEQYNTDQLITVRPPAAEGSTAAEGESRTPVIVARAGEIAGEAGRYADPRAQLSYAFDHLRLVSACLILGQQASLSG